MKKLLIFSVLLAVASGCGEDKSQDKKETSNSTNTAAQEAALKSQVHAYAMFRARSIEIPSEDYEQVATNPLFGPDKIDAMIADSKATVQDTILKCATHEYGLAGSMNDPLNISVSGKESQILFTYKIVTGKVYVNAGAGLLSTHAEFSYHLAGDAIKTWAESRGSTQKQGGWETIRFPPAVDSATATIVVIETYPAMVIEGKAQFDGLKACKKESQLEPGLSTENPSAAPNYMWPNEPAAP